MEQPELFLLISIETEYYRAAQYDFYLATITLVIISSI